MLTHGYSLKEPVRYENPMILNFLSAARLLRHLAAEKVATGIAVVSDFESTLAD